MLNIKDCYKIEIPIPEKFDLDNLSIDIFKNDNASGAIAQYSIDAESRVLVLSFDKKSFIYNFNGASILITNPINHIDPLTLETDGIYKIESNHYIAFTLLALIRDKVFTALRRLCPAKLEGRDKGDLISVITSDIELLEVFYAHTISPICIAVIMTIIMTIFISVQNIVLGMIALAAFIAVGGAVPILIFKISGNTADEYRAGSGQLSAFVLENLRGLDETIQYGAGERRIGELKSRAEELTVKQEKMSRSTGLNAAITNSVILIFDVIMLFAAVALCRAGTIGFNKALISVIAMMSGFGPVVALANLGSVLQIRSLPVTEYSIFLTRSP